MRKAVQLFGMLVAIALVLVPLSSATTTPSVPEKQTTVNQETTQVLCMVGNEKVTKDISTATLQSLLDLGRSKQEDFLTIYNKASSDDAVRQAFDNIQPFFRALVQSGLTDKTAEELTSLYYNIREKIREPRRHSVLQPQGGPQPLGIWNGLPTLVWGNIACGIFDTGLCVGFAAGTHAIIPTIGADAFITYAFQGTSTTVGAVGWTEAFAAFQIIFGFVGVLIATPLIMVGPYFMTGLCGAMFGVGA